MIEIYGEPVNKINNNSSSIKIINNDINSDLDPLIDPSTNQFVTYTSLITGSNVQAVVTVRQYHDVISGLNDLQSNFPSQTVEFSILGEPTNIAHILTPKSGLSSYSMSIGENGIQTNITFQTKPKTLPKQETILNNISARLPK